MKNRSIFIFVVAALLAIAFIWQYQKSQQVIFEDQRPMEIDLLLEPMEESANQIAEKSEYVYIGSSNQKVKVEKATKDPVKKQIVLTLSDQGKIFNDSAFFADQRLVYNTKTKVHSLFDGVGTVTRISYR